MCSSTRDTGRAREETLARLRDPRMLGGEPLARLVNTHCHSDHIGGNAAIARAYACPITIPRDEVPTIDDWSIQERWNAYVDQFAERILLPRYDRRGRVVPRRRPGVGSARGTGPRHGSARLLRSRRDRILLSGDALWENGLGFVWAHEPPNPFVEAALAAIATIERLAPRVVIPGHGEPFEDVAGAIARARSRLAAFARRSPPHRAPHDEGDVRLLHARSRRHRARAGRCLRGARSLLPRPRRALPGGGPRRTRPAARARISSAPAPCASTAASLAPRCPVSQKIGTVPIFRSRCRRSAGPRGRGSEGHRRRP